MKRSVTAVAVLAILLGAVAASAQKRVTRYATIPTGTRVAVRVIDSLSSDKATVGQEFRGTLEEPIYANGGEVYPKGADIVGRVTAVHRSGRLSDPGVLVLELRYVEYAGRRTTLHVEPFQIKGESHTKSNVTKIGGGAAVGAILGAIVGGGKGAAIGAGVGGAAGTGVAAATGKKEASVESEAVLEWTTSGTTSVTQAVQREPVYNQAPNATPGERSYDDAYAGDQGSRGEQPYADNGNYDRYLFSSRDRQIIRICFGENTGSLPPGLAKRDRLPPGLERQLQRNGTLPPGLQKRIQPLPGACESRLPRLPGVLRRAAYSGHIMLLNNANRIVDIFLLGGND